MCEFFSQGVPDDILDQMGHGPLDKEGIRENVGNFFTESFSFLLGRREDVMRILGSFLSGKEFGKFVHGIGNFNFWIIDSTTVSDGLRNFQLSLESFRFIWILKQI